MYVAWLPHNDCTHMHHRFPETYPSTAIASNIQGTDDITSTALLLQVSQSQSFTMSLRAAGGSPADSGNMWVMRRSYGQPGAAGGDVLDPVMVAEPCGYWASEARPKQ